MDILLGSCNSDHGSGIVEAKLLPPQQQTRIVVKRLSEAQSSARLGAARAELDVPWTWFVCGGKRPYTKLAEWMLQNNAHAPR